MNATFWSGKSVFITGHTGFKGGWLAHWLSEMGSKVHGYSLDPPTELNFFVETGLGDRLEQSIIGDVLDLVRLKKALESSNPDIVFHLAAQPLVLESYSHPLGTLATNIMGTANLLEACRSSDSILAIVNVTSDKCYQNREWLWPYRETEPLGGRDPYSVSKACAEMITDAYRESFLAERGIHLASARAGNVIGGGDWAKDRLVPDCLRAFDSGETLNVRSPNAIRPWQHVIEPLAGYLTLAEKLCAEGVRHADSWNFGPDEADSKPVRWIADRLSYGRQGARWTVESQEYAHEAGYLRLDSSKARAILGWTPRWGLEVALNKTVEWHDAWRSKSDMAAVTSAQIKAYVGP